MTFELEFGFTVVLDAKKPKHQPVGQAGGLRFKPRAGQIEHSVANGLPPLEHFFKRNYVARRHFDEMYLYIYYLVFTTFFSSTRVNYDT